MLDGFLILFEGIVSCSDISVIGGYVRIDLYCLIYKLNLFFIVS